MSSPVRLPARVHLPSGRVVRLGDAAARDAARDAGSAEGPLLRDLAILRAPGVLADDAGQPLDPDELAVRDAHVLRALLAHAGVVDEPPGEYTCSNCAEPFRAAPSTLLEIGPFVDGELDAPELDAPFPYDVAHSVPPIRVGGRVARSIRLAPRDVAGALPLWRAASSPTLRLTPSIVAAMGVVAIGTERRAAALADALADASKPAWRAVVDLFHDASYPRRLEAVHRCAACGARNFLDVPLARELDRGSDEEGDSPAAGVRRRARRGRPAFPDLDAFEAGVRAAAERLYRARGVRNVDLFVDAGVPACDEGGEPLLGCYTPGGVDAELGVQHAPEIRIFYRSFRSEYEADESFDVEAEIRETIDHELTHHLHHLAGSDPLDDEERTVIAEEKLRTVGRRETVRRAARSVPREITGFLRTTAPLFLVLAVAGAIAFCSGGGP